MIQYLNIREIIEKKSKESDVILLSLFETSEFYVNEKTMITERFISIDNDGHWFYNSIPICVGNATILLG